MNLGMILPAQKILDHSVLYGFNQIVTCEDVVDKNVPLIDRNNKKVDQ